MIRLYFEIEIVTRGSIVEISGIPFEGVAFVRGTEMSLLRAFMDETKSLLVPEELERSLQGDGEYLLLTDASGIADDGGWHGITVHHTRKEVFWSLREREGTLTFTFSKDKYEAEIESVMAELRSLPAGIVAEPQHVIFPENW
jgi:hypothetical protein